MKIELAVFDIEGTISDRIVIPTAVVAGFEHLRSKGVKTTVVTGTGFIRVKELLGDYFDLIVSDGIPIGVENGGKLVSKSGENISHSPLMEEERIGFLTYSFSLNPEYVVHYPQKRERAVIWTPDKERAQEMREKYSFFADIYNDEESKVLDRTKEDNPSIIITRPGIEYLNQEVPSHLNTVVNEGSIHLNTQGVDKGSAMLEIARQVGVNVNAVLVAGNYYNDLPMFQHPVGQRVLVGNLDISAFPFASAVNKVSTIEQLGEYLQNS